MQNAIKYNGKGNFGERLLQRIAYKNLVAFWKGEVT